MSELRKQMSASKRIVTQSELEYACESQAITVAVGEKQGAMFDTGTLPESNPPKETRQGQFPVYAKVTTKLKGTAANAGFRRYVFPITPLVVADGQIGRAHV